MTFPPPPQRTRQRRAPLAVVFHLLLAVWAAVASAEERGAEGYTVDHIVEQLNYRVAQVQDLSATISFVRIGARDGSRTEGTVRIEAVFPHVIRATFLGPPLWEGVVFILDAERNTLTQYTPTTGQADVYALDEMLRDLGGTREIIPVRPEDLFTLPSPDEFNLAVVEVKAENGREYAVVDAAAKAGAERYRLWVDTVDWIVTRIESMGSDGKVKDAADAIEVKINQGISAPPLRTLPPGATVRRVS